MKKSRLFFVALAAITLLLGYGSDVLSQVTVPVVSITSATIIPPRTVKITGEIISTGGESITWLGAFCEPERERWYETYYDHGKRYEAGSFDVTLWTLTEGSTSQCGVFAWNSAGYGYSTNRITAAIPPIDNPKTVVDTFSLNWADASPVGFTSWTHHTYSVWDVENRKVEIVLDKNIESSDLDDNHAWVFWNPKTDFVTTSVHTLSVEYGDRLDFNIFGTAVDGEEATLIIGTAYDEESSNLYAKTNFTFGEKIPPLIIKPLLNRPAVRADIYLHIMIGNEKPGTYIFPEKIYLTRTRIVPTLPPPPPKKPVNMAPIYLLLLGS